MSTPSHSHHFNNITDSDVWRAVANEEPAGTKETHKITKYKSGAHVSTVVLKNEKSQTCNEQITLPNGVKTSYN
jgi:hypothetical protein